MRERIRAFEFIRAVCAFGIVLFHYSYNYVEYGISGNAIHFYRYPNGDWGGLFVAMFFMMSGAVLIYNYENNFRVGSFYFKRWLSIFPMFYLAWLIAYLFKVKELGMWYWGGPRKNIIYTILGVDGYFLNPGVTINYYTLGEWFLGAIVMLYALFPLLRWCYVNYTRRICFSIFLATAYIWNLYTDYFSIADGKSMLTATMDFWLGMLIMCGLKRIKEDSSNTKLQGKVSTISLVLAVGLMIFPFDMIWGDNANKMVPGVLVATMAGGLLTIAFLYYGEIIMKNRVVAQIAGAISRFSFGIFLVHHVILYAFMKPFGGTTVNFLKSLVLFAIVFAIIMVVGGILSLYGELVTGLVKRFAAKIKEKSFKDL